MKRKNFRVNQNLDNHVLIDGKPFDIASVKFTRVRPQDVMPISHIEVTQSDFRSNSIIDDMLYQIEPDTPICATCGCVPFEDTEIVVNGITYCDDLCLIRSDD